MIPDKCSHGKTWEEGPWYFGMWLYPETLIAAGVLIVRAAAEIGRRME